MTTRLQLRRALALAAGVGLTAIVLTATGAGPAIAQGAKPLLTLIVNEASNPVPVQTVGSTLTHLGRPVADLVHLRWVDTPECFKRLTANAVVDADCYQVPAGRTLLITDVQWQVVQFPGSSINFWLYSGLTGETLFAASAVAGIQGYAVGDHHFQTGFIFDPALRPTSSGGTQLFGYLVSSQ